MLTEHFRPPVALLDLSRRSSDEILLSNFLCAASLLRRYVHLGLTRQWQQSTSANSTSSTPSIA
jgi:hypothetical protein